MKKTYQHFSTDERNHIHTARNNGLSIRTIGCLLDRAPSSIAREIKRNTSGASYDANNAADLAQARRQHRRRKLALGTPLFSDVCALLSQGWSPQQIAGRLRKMETDKNLHVSHETIYCAIYALPKGELRSDLIALLRKKHKSRQSRAKGTDRRGTLPNMRSIHLRPVEVAARMVPGHWEGDLIKGAGNRSAVGTLVERTSRYLILTKLPDASADSVLEHFSKRFRHVPECMRKTLTYDQGREMAKHEMLSKRLKIDIYFADPHSPWQRGTNENTNGLIREYLPKGLDLSQFSQGYLNAIARALNNRPRKCLQFETPAEAYAREVMKLQPSVALQP